MHVYMYVHVCVCENKKESIRQKNKMTVIERKENRKGKIIIRGSKNRGEMIVYYSEN